MNRDGEAVSGALMALARAEGSTYASDAISTSVTPTAALAADQPTAISVPLMLPSPTLREQHHLAHTSDTTSTSVTSVLKGCGSDSRGAKR